MSHDPVLAHYANPDLGEALLDALRAAGKDPAALTIDDLVPVDHFHGRGIRATRELAEMAAPQPDERVLDVGCGIGGPARYLAATYGCTVEGVDLSATYCEVATMLTERVGLADKVAFRPASALTLPFPDGSFDLVWTQNVQMNVPDKRAFYGELKRVTRPGGRIAFSDVLQGTGGAPYYPVPWADDSAISHLVTVETLHGVLADVGLRVAAWEDLTERSLEWRRKTANKAAEAPPRPLGIHLLLGPDHATKQRNNFRNADEGRIALVHGVLERPPA